jgi:hypothetical protein
MKMRHAAILAAAICALSVTGCTMFIRTAAVPIAEAFPVPGERLLAYVEKQDGFATVEVTRDAGFMDGGCYIGLVIAGKLAARFDTQETAEFHVPAGESNMAVVRDPLGRGLCSFGAWEPVPEHYLLKPDSPNLFRISSGAYRRPRLLPAVY